MRSQEPLTDLIAVLSSLNASDGSLGVEGYTLNPKCLNLVENRLSNPRNHEPSTLNPKPWKPIPETFSCRIYDGVRELDEGELERLERVGLSVDDYCRALGVDKMRKSTSIDVVKARWCTLNPQPSTLNTQHSNLNPQPVRRLRCSSLNSVMRSVGPTSVRVRDIRLKMFIQPHQSHTHTSRSFTTQHHPRSQVLIIALPARSRARIVLVRILDDNEDK